MKKIQALFVDRDGTLIEDKHYLSDPKGVCLLPTVGEALQKIVAQGIRIFVVTNQSGIGRGYFQVQDLVACQEELAHQLKEFGVVICDTAYCPHSPEEACECRKPSLGMWEQVQKTHNLDPQLCAMIGDKKEDVAFGLNANFAVSALVSTGKGQDVAQKLGLEFGETTKEFSASIIDECFVKSTTTCFTAQRFSDVVDYFFKD